ncbi:MAG: oligosaccharide flippase family protein [Clostridia bacterium]|nr:oligosaccharide flippase family protein [Clostridia bacterium]
MFGITLASSGINLATTRVISEELECGNEFGVKRAAKRCILLSLCVSVLASFIFFINADFIVKVFLKSKVSANIIYLISLALPLISVCSSLNGYFTAVRKAYKNAIRSNHRATYQNRRHCIFIKLVFPFRNRICLLCFNTGRFGLRNHGLSTSLRLLQN